MSSILFIRLVPPSYIYIMHVSAGSSTLNKEMVKAWRVSKNLKPCPAAWARLQAKRMQQRTPFLKGSCSNHLTSAQPMNYTRWNIEQLKPYGLKNHTLKDREIGCSRSVTPLAMLPFRERLFVELPSSFTHRLDVSWHYQPHRATRRATAVDTTEKQQFQSEALFHSPVHRTEHTHALRSICLDGRCT